MANEFGRECLLRSFADECRNKGSIISEDTITRNTMLCCETPCTHALCCEAHRLTYMKSEISFTPCCKMALLIYGKAINDSSLKLMYDKQIIREVILNGDDFWCTEHTITCCNQGIIHQYALFHKC